MEEFNDEVIITAVSEREIECEGVPLEIVLEKGALEQMEAYAGTDLSRELAGVMLGEIKPREQKMVVCIKAAIEARDTRAQRSSVTFTHQSWQYINEVQERLFPDLKVVGWFHTHPGFGIFLSEYDLFIHRNFFNLAGQVALVIDPVAGERGMFGWQGEALELYEYTLADSGLANGGYLLSGGEKPVHTDEPYQSEGRSGFNRRKNIPKRAAFFMVIIMLLGIGYYAHVYRSGSLMDQAQVKPLPAQLPATVPDPDPTTRPTGQVEVKVFANHQVEPGDSLWTISTRYYGSGLHYLDIAVFNHIEPGNYIHPGQVLAIPDVEEENM